MLYLILSILVSVGIFLVFHNIGVKGISPLPIISVNYFIALLAGTITLQLNHERFSLQSPAFYGAAIVIGVLFMLLFLVVHKSINVSGISTTSAAAKLSVVFPVLVSLVIDKNDSMYPRKIVGIVVLLLSFYFIVSKSDNRSVGNKKIIIPLLLFIGLGFVDSLVKLAQQLFIPEDSVSSFTLLVFFVAACTGIIILFIKKENAFFFKKTNLILGIALGLFNYGSLFFLIKALNLNLIEGQFLDSSRIFMVNNLGVILLSTMVGVLFYKEKLHLMNFLGIMLSIIGFYLIM